MTYRHTLYASYLGYITQAIVNNLPPLLFIVFSRDFDISLSQIGLLISLNFGVQIATDLVCAKLLDRIGYRIAAVVAHALGAAGAIEAAAVVLSLASGVRPTDPRAEELALGRLAQAEAWLAVTPG